MIATIVLAAALVPPCPLIPSHHHKRRALVAPPVASCVLPPSVLTIAPEESIDPVQTTAWPKYVILESASPDCAYATGGGYAVGGIRARAPEIDPASAASGLTLLFGALAVIRGRRHA